MGNRRSAALTTVLICDDSHVVRDGLRAYVARIPGVSRVEIATRGEDAIARYRASRPHLVLMDVNMPGIGCVEATRQLVRSHPDANVVVLTVAADRDAVATAVAAGARGYLSKDVGPEELCAAIAHTGATTEQLARQEAAGRPPAPTYPTARAVSERDLQVLRGMSQGKSNSAIGRELYLSVDAIKTRARGLFRKMGANDRAHAVALGFRAGLLR
jgi:DNA-binding NarL/FixJ family response regulator